MRESVCVWARKCTSERMCVRETGNDRERREKREGK